jgi:hypothetical protein
METVRWSREMESGQSEPGAALADPARGGEYFIRYGAQPAPVRALARARAFPIPYLLRVRGAKAAYWRADSGTHRSDREAMHRFAFSSEVVVLVCSRSHNTVRIPSDPARSVNG